MYVHVYIYTHIYVYMCVFSLFCIHTDTLGAVISPGSLPSPRKHAIEKLKSLWDAVRAEGGAQNCKHPEGQQHNGISGPAILTVSKGI